METILLRRAFGGSSTASKESFRHDRDGRDDGYDRHGRSNVFGGMETIVSVVFLILFGVPAAYLSWTSNTTVGWHWGFKLVFALFAFTFGLTYLVAHLLHKLDLLMLVRRLSYVRVSAYVPPPPPASRWKQQAPQFGRQN
jgi:hypothetical protein